MLLVSLLALHPFAGAQDTSIKKAIAPEAFHAAALKDGERIVSFQSVATGLADGSVVLIDLRSPAAFAKSHIGGAKNLPATELTDESFAKVIPSKASKVVIYCDNNFSMTRRVPLTTIAYPVFKQLGYAQTQVLASSFSNEIAPLVLEGSYP